MSDPISCPRAHSDMTPCIARDGAVALGDAPGPVCVGCGADPFALLHELGDRHAPARRYRQTKDAKAAAGRLKEQVRDYVEKASDV